MFEGIIHIIGKIVALEYIGANAKVAIEAEICSPVKVGDSIACAGACLTVVSINGHIFEFDVSHETFNKTNFQKWSVGQEINMETALLAGKPINGYLTQGHIDCTASVKHIQTLKEHRVITFSIPKTYIIYIAPKGGLCLDGVAITANTVNSTQSQFTANIIPYTWNNTTFRKICEGELLNLEVDTIARYVVNAQNNTPFHCPQCKQQL